MHIIKYHYLKARDAGMESTWNKMQRRSTKVTEEWMNSWWIDPADLDLPDHAVQHRVMGMLVRLTPSI